MNESIPDLSALGTNQKADRVALENMERSGNMTAIPIGIEFPPMLQNAFNRACEQGHFRFVNVRIMEVPIPGQPHPVKSPAMVYMMTPLGSARLRELREIERLSVRIAP